MEKDKENTTVADPEEKTDENVTEVKSDLGHESVYKFGKATYIVRTHFNLEAKETLKDVVERLIMKEIDEQLREEFKI